VRHVHKWKAYALKKVELLSWVVEWGSNAPKRTFNTPLCIFNANNNVYKARLSRQRVALTNNVEESILEVGYATYMPEVYKLYMASMSLERADKPLK